MKVRRAASAMAVMAMAGVALFVTNTPAQAATVPAQLSFSGVGTSTTPLGGPTVGLHPGDTLALTAASAPTAGLDKLGLGGLVDGLLAAGSSYEVIVHLPASFPGGSRNLTLTPKSTAQINFPNAGTFPFTWNAYSVTTLPLAAPVVTQINPPVAQLKSAGVALNSAAQWVGQVVVSNTPPTGGIGIHLPSVSVSPSLPGVTLPPVSVPGVTTPSLPGLPGLPNLPGGAPSVKPGVPGSLLHYTPYGTNVEDGAVPKGYGDGSGAAQQYVAPGVYVPGGSSAQNGSAAGSTTGSAVNGGSKAAAGKAASATARPTAVDLAASTEHPAVTGMPSLLVMGAILALSAATALYARSFLVRRISAARVTTRR